MVPVCVYTAWDDDFTDVWMFLGINLGKGMSLKMATCINAQLKNAFFNFKRNNNSSARNDLNNLFLKKHIVQHTHTHIHVFSIIHTLW